MQKIPVWDAATRLFHWALVLSIVAMWWTASEGGDWLEWHTRLGQALAVGLIFRVAWGIWGSQTARFSDFIHGPKKLIGYLTQRWQKPYGHNPLGGLMVVVMLLALILQVGLGLFALDENGYVFDGPFAALIAEESASQATKWHKQFFDVLLILIGLHITAIVLYRLLKQQNLVNPMLTGSIKLNEEVPPKPYPKLLAWYWALITLIGAIVLFVWLKQLLLS